MGILNRVWRSNQEWCAQLADTIGMTGLLCRIQQRRYHPFLRAINYHGMSHDDRDRLDAQFQFLAENYTCLSQKGLDDFLAGKRSLAKPGLLITFDDGYQSQYDIAAPILEKHGLSGWFFVITAACDRDRKIIKTDAEALNTAYFMNWSHLSKLIARGHTIGCHTHNHRNVGKLQVEEFPLELEQSKQTLEDQLEIPIRSFCFPFGTADSYSSETLKLLTKHYDYLFHSFPRATQPGASPYSLGRIPCEPAWSPATLKLRLSGLYDRRYRKALRQYNEALHSIQDPTASPRP